MLPSLLPAAMAWEGTGSSCLMLASSCGCAAKHQMSPELPSACLLGSPVLRFHSVMDVEPPMLNSRNAPRLYTVVSSSSSVSTSCVHASCSTERPSRPLNIDSCTHLLPRGFHISTSPLFSRPTARRKSGGPGSVGLELWEKARALIACGGKDTNRQRWISIFELLATTCYSHTVHPDNCSGACNLK